MASISRLFTTLASQKHLLAANQIRRWLQRYKDIEDLIRIGAYQSGRDPETDTAIAQIEAIRMFAEQPSTEPAHLSETLDQLFALAGVSA